jgi:hypothetical protein
MIYMKKIKVTFTASVEIVTEEGFSMDEITTDYLENTGKLIKQSAVIDNLECTCLEVISEK